MFVNHHYKDKKKNISIFCGITDIKAMYKKLRFHLAMCVYSDNAQRMPKHECSYLLTPSARNQSTHGHTNGILGISVK